MKKNSPQKHFFRHKVRHILSEEKLLLFALQMNDIYWKRRTMTVAFQRMSGILERWNNNQVTPSFSKPHELSYRSNTWFVPFMLWIKTAPNSESLASVSNWKSNEKSGQVKIGADVKSSFIFSKASFCSIPQSHFLFSSSSLFNGSIISAMWFEPSISTCHSYQSL